MRRGNPYLTVYDGVLYNKEMTILRYYPAADSREVFEIPEGILSIGAGAFAGNTHLKEVIMPDTVLRIQIMAFEYCKNLEKINISTCCKWIDQYVFSGTALESIHIPASLVTLYCGSFGIDSRIKTITVDLENPVYYVDDGVLYANLTEEYVSSSCHIPGLWLVKYPSLREDTSFTVPEGIVGIDQQAFDNVSNLTEVVLPESLQIIFPEAFWNCSRLAKIELPPNLTHIYDQPFADCTGLVELVIPASVEWIDYYLCSGLQLEKLVFLGDAPELYDQTFLNSADTLNVYYPAGNTTWEPVIQMYAHENGIRFIEMCETHQFESENQEATCTQPGYTGRRCSVCAIREVTGISGPATGHDYFLGICVKCGESKSQDGTVGLDAMGYSMITLGVMLGIPVLIAFIVLLRKAVRKLRKR